MAKLITTQAVVLFSDHFGEADSLVTLYAKSLGKVKCLAKGARKSKKRFMNALEPFNILTAKLRTKSKDRLILLESASIRLVPESVRQDYKCYLYASLSLELVDLWIRDFQKDREIFDLLLWFINSLEAGASPLKNAIIFQAKLLKIAGYMPELDKCKRCKQDIKGRYVGFSIQTGQMICRQCLRDMTTNIMSFSTLKTLIHICKTSLDLVGRLQISENSSKELWKYLKERHCFCLEQEPRSFSLMKCHR